MNAPAALLVIRWLVWDTFRQGLASRVFWVMLFVSAVCIAFCATASTAGLPEKPTAERPERLPPADAAQVPPFELSKSGVDVIEGEWRFLFGAVRVPWGTYREDAVRWLQLLLAGGVADTVGLLLALVWTAAFLPTFLEPGAVTVLLAKPVPRWSLLAGKYIGVVVFVAVQAAVFVGGTWLALGVRTGVWAPQYLLAVPLLVTHFAVFFSFSCLLAVWTRSTIACVVGSLVFWLLCWGMNFGRHAALASLASHADVAADFSRALEWGYWLLPKPADLSFALSKALEADQYFPTATELQAVERMGAVNLGASLLSSAAFALGMLAIAGYEFVQADY